MPTKVSLRNKLDKEFTWNAESVFPSHQAWESEVEETFAIMENYIDRIERLLQNNIP